jgi:hypothetical protein
MNQPDEDPLRELRERLADSCEYERYDAALELVRLGQGREAVPVLFDMLSSGEGNVSAEGERVLNAHFPDALAYVLAELNAPQRQFGDWVRHILDCLFFELRPEVAPHLWETLRARGPGMSDALYVLLRRRDTGAARFGLLIDYLQEDEFDLRRTVIDACTRRYPDYMFPWRDMPEEAFLALAGLLAHPDYYIATDAGSVLWDACQSAPPNVIPRLAPALVAILKTTREPHVASLAIRCLEGLGPPAVAFAEQALRELVENTSEPGLKAEAEAALSKLSAARP